MGARFIPGEQTCVAAEVRSSPKKRLHFDNFRLAENSKCKSFFLGNFPSEARLFVAQGHYRFD